MYNCTSWMDNSLAGENQVKQGNVKNIMSTDMASKNFRMCLRKVYRPVWTQW